MKNQDYWEECIGISFDECGIVATDEQLKYVAGDARTAHENYGLAYYQPPSSDRVAEVEREWKRKYEELEKKLDSYQKNAQEAVRMALKQPSGSNLSIGEHGEVYRHDGRTTQIQ